MSFEVKYPRLELMVACDTNLGIGKDGTLPWSIPSEFAYYLRMTQNNRENSEGKVHASIFGWANWQSIAKMFKVENPWKDTICFILSEVAQEHEKADVYVCTSFQEIIDHLQRPEIKERIDRVWVHGGNSVFNEAFRSPHFYRLYQTRIENVYPADVFFPQIDESLLTLIHDPETLQGVQHENDVAFQVQVYQSTGVCPLPQ